MSPNGRPEQQLVEGQFFGFATNTQHLKSIIKAISTLFAAIFKFKE